MFCCVIWLAFALEHMCLSFLCPTVPFWRYPKLYILLNHIRKQSVSSSFASLQKAIIPSSRCWQLLSQQTSNHKSMTNYFSLSRHTNYPLISPTMNGNVLSFHVGFWVTLAHCITLKMWVFNQSIFYFSVYLWKQRPVPICCCVNYRTIKARLNDASKWRGRLYISELHILWKWRQKITKKIHRVDNINKTKIFPNSLSLTAWCCPPAESDVFMQSIPIQAPFVV